MATVFCVRHRGTFHSFPHFGRFLPELLQSNSIMELISLPAPYYHTALSVYRYLSSSVTTHSPSWALGQVYTVPSVDSTKTNYGSSQPWSGLFLLFCVFFVSSYYATFSIKLLKLLTWFCYIVRPMRTVHSMRGGDILTLLRQICMTNK